MPTQFLDELTLAASILSPYIIIATILTSGLLFASCDRKATEQNPYPEDLALSKPNGEPNDSFTVYFPTSIKRDSFIIKTGMEFSNWWYSRSLFGAQEPVLYNFYLGHDIYRFLWLRAFSPPLTFSLHKDGSKVWLTTKKLDRQPSIPMKTMIYFTGPDGQEPSESEKAKREKERDSINAAGKIVNLIFTDTKNLSMNEWKKFEQLLYDCGYWTMTTSMENTTGIDGSNWIIEAHLKNKYWVVDRWVPKDNFRKCGEYLIDLSGVNEMRY